MELTQENVEKLNVAKMPDALLCKGYNQKCERVKELEEVISKMETTEEK